MELEVRKTGDGSDTLFRADLGEHYHSTFGAVQESQHVFIEAGFLHAVDNHLPGFGQDSGSLNILEIGFGTGLNALLTQAEAEKRGIRAHYTAIEAYPLDEGQWQLLNYPRRFGSLDYLQVFNNLHTSAWDRPEVISPNFTLHKIHMTLEVWQPEPLFSDLVYFDAFGPEVQPELWTEQVFRKISQGMRPGGTLVTYSVKGTVVRALKSVGFCIEKLPGPPGKRHILRAVKWK